MVRKREVKGTEVTGAAIESLRQVVEVAEGREIRLIDFNVKTVGVHKNQSSDEEEMKLKVQIRYVDRAPGVETGEGPVMGSIARADMWLRKGAEGVWHAFDFTTVYVYTGGPGVQEEYFADWSFSPYRQQRVETHHSWWEQEGGKVRQKYQCWRGHGVTDRTLVREE